MSYLGKETTSRPCNSCRSIFNEDDSMKNGHYFMYIPIQQQLESMLSNSNLYKHLTDNNLEHSLNSETIQDVTTCELYKDLINKYGFSTNDISITCNTDGAQVSKSSKFSIWPLQASVNELPAYLRAKNILLIGLWFGGKPHMKTFFTPFADECTKLQKDGFTFGTEHKPRRVYPLLLCADAPARALVRNAKQFNGRYGCDWCETPGEAVPINNGPVVRYYPHRTPIIHRVAAKQAKDALKASASQPIKGVKGITVMDFLPSFDPVRGIAADYMHSVCQGTVIVKCTS